MHRGVAVLFLSFLVIVPHVLDTMRAVGNNGRSSPYVADLATTIIFTDSTLTGAIANCPRTRSPIPHSRTR